MTTSRGCLSLQSEYVIYLGRDMPDKRKNRDEKYETKKQKRGKQVETLKQQQQFQTAKRDSRCELLSDKDGWNFRLEIRQYDSQSHTSLFDYAPLYFNIPPCKVDGPEKKTKRQMKTK